MLCVTMTGSTITRKTIEESDDRGAAKQKSDEVSPTYNEHTPKHREDGGGKRSRRDEGSRSYRPYPSSEHSSVGHSRGPSPSPFLFIHHFLIAWVRMKAVTSDIPWTNTVP